ncbi:MULTISPECIES: 23S rRNA (pseudouridine(1915)-N(3))-methyltransferase RlmH [unclassified Inquilinus]|uniref:23S rRNA (pseudouridine(1915)-N(3))-methyltransferase RlmH n=1 Tax=unclassified Inquilinus TaxID=2645927 RepID=UPI003F8FB2A9
MRLTIAAVGRAKAGPLRDLFDEYVGRSAWPISLREVEARKGLAGPTLRREEAALLLAAVPAGAAAVVLDERGRDLDSAGLARVLGRWRDEGRGDAAFLIGGADGHDDAVRDRADLLLSFGRLTWPHMLARTMLAEQIYRAQTILSGHPYHRA